MNLEPTAAAPNSNLWFGTAMHYALEDYHGHNEFGKPMEALVHFPERWLEASDQPLPDDTYDLLELGDKMLKYYMLWDKQNGREYKTWWYEGEPQVEITFSIDMKTRRGRRFQYSGRFDRIVKDPMGALWIQDYKTAKRLPSKTYLQIDAQAGAYAWAARRIFGVHFEGVIFTHLLKQVAKGPKFKPGFVSVNKAQKTSGILYKKAMRRAFPDNIVPEKVLDFYNGLLEREDTYGDPFVNVTQVRKTPEALKNEEKKILLESGDMLNPRLVIYPNPTWTCVWDCPFMNACLEMDDGQDIDEILEAEFQVRPPRPEAWFKEEAFVWQDSH